MSWMVAGALWGLASPAQAQTSELKIDGGDGTAIFFHGRPPTPTFPLAMKALCYPSGLKVWVVEHEGRPLAGVAAVVDAGASDELPNEVGAAHVLEHLWFRSPRVGEGSTSDALGAIGAEMNAYTGHDSTTYVTVANKRSLRSLLVLEVARMEGPMDGLTDEDIEREKRVVQQEIAQKYDGADGALTALSRAFVTPDYPYARSVGGSVQEVGALTRVELNAFALRMYRPDNLTLKVQAAGDVVDFTYDAEQYPRGERL